MRIIRLCQWHVVGGCMLALTALAQDSSEGRRLEEMIVTAQNRSERLQYVPIAVSTIDADVAERPGIRSSVEIPLITPGVSITPQGGSTGIAVREVCGVTHSGAESAHAVYVAGAHQSATPSLQFVLNNTAMPAAAAAPRTHGVRFGMRLE